MPKQKQKTVTEKTFRDGMDYLHLMNQVIPCKEHGVIDCTECKSYIIRNIKIIKGK